MSKSFSSMNAFTEKRWSHTEIEYLHEHAQDKTIEDLAMHLNRTGVSVKEMMVTFGLTVKPKQEQAKPESFYWTPEQETFLKENFQTKTNLQLSSDLHRSVQAIQNRLLLLGLKRTQLELNKLKLAVWTADEIAYLINNFTNLTWRQIAEHLKRKVGAVTCKARELKLRRTSEQIKALLEKATVKSNSLENNYNKWSQEEKIYLTENWNRQTARQISTHLKRSVSSIKVKAQLLKLSNGDRGFKRDVYIDQHIGIKGEKIMSYSPQEDKFLIDNYEVLSLKEIARTLNRTEQSIRARLKRIKSSSSNAEKLKKKIIPIDYHP